MAETAPEPVDAIEIIVEHAVGRSRDRCIQLFVDNVPTTDPQEALELLEVIPEGQSKNNALQKVMAGLVAVDTKFAIRHAEGLSSTVEAERAFSGILDGIMGRGGKPTESAAPQLLDRLASALEVSEHSLLRKYLIGEATDLLLDNHPLSAAEWLWTQEESESLPFRVEVAAQLANSDPLQLRGFLDAMNSEEGQLAVVDSAVEAMTLRNPESALEWTRGLERPLREHAIRQLTSTWHGFNREGVMNWALAEEDLETRRVAVTRLQELATAASHDAARRPDS